MNEVEMGVLGDQPALVMRRDVAAPLDQVWQAVSDAARLQKWFLPGGSWPWIPSSRLSRVLGEPDGSSRIDAATRTALWQRGPVIIEFRVTDHQGGPQIQLALVVEAGTEPDRSDEDPVSAAVLAQIALDRLQTYLDGDALTLDAFLDRAALGRSADHWAAQLGLDPASAKADLVQDPVVQAQADSDGDAWQFEPDPAVADAMAEVMAGYLEDHQDRLAELDAAGDGLETALSEWVFPSARSAQEVGTRMMFAFDQVLAGRPLTPEALETAWQAEYPVPDSGDATDR